MAHALSTTSTAFSPPTAEWPDTSAWRSTRASAPRRGHLHVVAPGYSQSADTLCLQDSGPLIQYIAALEERAHINRQIRSQIAARLRELQIDARLSGDPLSTASLLDLFRFLSSINLAHRPAIFLLDNGNFRALWKNSENEQVGLQFLGDEVVQYVIFSRRADHSMLTADSGRESLSNIRAKITATSSYHLLSDDKPVARARFSDS